MIPDAVEHLEKILVDLLALLNDILGVAAQLDPPVAGVDIRKLGQLVLRRVEGDESAAVCLGADAVDMRAVFQVFLRVGIGPDGLDKGHGLAAVDRGEHDGIAHLIVVGLFRGRGFVELVLRFRADTALRPGHHADRAVAGGVDEDLAVDRPARLGGILAAGDGEDAVTVQDDVVDVGIQEDGDVRLHPHLFPDDGIEDREVRIGVAALVFEQDLLKDARLAEVRLGGMAVGANDVHPRLRLPEPPNTGRFCTRGDLRALTRRGDRGADAGKAAARDDHVEGGCLFMNSHSCCPFSGGSVLNVDDHLHGAFAVGVDILIGGQEIAEGKMLADEGLELDLALGDKAERVHIILVPVHHGGIEREFGVIEAGQVDLCPVGKDGDEDDHGAFAAVLDGHVRGGVIAGTFVGDVGLIRAENLCDGVCIGDFGGIDRVVRAEGLCQLQAIVRDVGDEHLRRAERLAGLHEQDADRTAADDGDVRPLMSGKRLAAWTVTASGSMSAASS